MKTRNQPSIVLMATMLFLSFAFSTCISNVGARTTISGTVSDSTGRRLANLKLSLVGERLKGGFPTGFPAATAQQVRTYSLSTDANGKFSQEVSWSDRVSYYDLYIISNEVVNGQIYFYRVISCVGSSLTFDCRVTQAKNISLPVVVVLR